ncbi:hypothetical protein J6590_060090 [Homalodisca vitripennis]|nr:hypothetical protein J6590_060090 [Homalodisca vitripennis]
MRHSIHDTFAGSPYKYRLAVLIALIAAESAKLRTRCSDYAMTCADDMNPGLVPVVHRPERAPRANLVPSSPRD